MNHGRLTDRRFRIAQIKGGVDPETGKFRAVANAKTVDRYNEVLEPRGADLEAFRANPVLLACHLPYTESGDSPVVGKVVSIETTDVDVPFEGQFAPTELGRQYRTLYGGGFMRAFSVGFAERKAHTETAKSQRIRVIDEWELYEISCVPVPANRESLIKLVRSDDRGVAEAANILAMTDMALWLRRMLPGFPAVDVYERQQRAWEEDDYCPTEEEERAAAEYADMILYGDWTGGGQAADVDGKLLSLIEGA